ncbi:uncharacterized protein [Oscarella lobularis]|uniref:uncharacterized protein n=1 Tax=Oscarella lobularis TaxID=121494 RepID=UPI003313A266
MPKGRNCGALIRAVSASRTHQVRLLLKQGSWVDSRDERGRTALILATLIKDEKTCTDIFLMLWERRADPNVVDHAHKRTALHYACETGRRRLVRLLLDGNEVDLNARDDKGETALAIAVVSGDFLLVEMIVVAMAKYRLSIDVPDARGVCPLVRAQLTGNRDVFRLLKRYSQHHDVQWNDVTQRRTLAKSAPCRVSHQPPGITVSTGPGSSFNAATSMLRLRSYMDSPVYRKSRCVSAPFNVRQIVEKCREENRRREQLRVEQRWVKVKESMATSEKMDADPGILKVATKMQRCSTTGVPGRLQKRTAAVKFSPKSLSYCSLPDSIQKGPQCFSLSRPTESQSAPAKVLTN